MAMVSQGLALTLHAMHSPHSCSAYHTVQPPFCSLGWSLAVCQLWLSGADFQAFVFLEQIKQLLQFCGLPPGLRRSLLTIWPDGIQSSLVSLVRASSLITLKPMMGRSMSLLATRMGTRTGLSLIPATASLDKVISISIHPLYGIAVPLAAESSSEPSSSSSVTGLTST